MELFRKQTIHRGNAAGLSARVAAAAKRDLTRVMGPGFKNLVAGNSISAISLVARSDGIFKDEIVDGR
jgi:hypothetical protein